MKLVAPFAGWCLPLAEVPDAVFAQGMAGEGLAIDPTEDVLRAPCDGTLVDMKGARHAVTLRTREGVEVLLHVGIDTVKLAGAGFEPLAAAGAAVRQGTPLLRFDLDALARGAPSLVTPMVIASGATIVRCATGRRVQAGDVVMEVRVASAGDAAGGGAVSQRARLVVPFEHGLHVRPAAQVAAALRPFGAEVLLARGERRANARSTVAMMALDARCGDEVEAIATGPDAAAALAALGSLFMPAGGKPVQAAPAPPAPVTGTRFPGVIASRGLARGPAVPWRAVDEPAPTTTRGEMLERAALDEALVRVREHLLAQAAKLDGEHGAILQAHVELLQDPSLHEAAAMAIAQGQGAAASWRQACRDTAQTLGSLGDARMRARAADLRDLENQVLRVLAGKPPVSRRTFPPGCIVLAEDLLPSQWMALEAQGIGGVCTARGGATSHVAILACAAGIPALVAAGAGALEIPEGTPLTLDAEQGWLAVDDAGAAGDHGAAARRAQREADERASGEPALLRDDTRIAVLANVASAREAHAALSRGAEGCGLLRTEFLFLDRAFPPAMEEQAREYQAIADALRGHPLTVRTLDAGGDKPIAYMPMPREDNPALGMRGLRAMLARPELLRAQLGALVRVRPACRVLLPMVTDVGELLQVREMLAACAAEAGAPVPALGVMVETPASALLAPALAPHADFFSLGTNDLAQYTLAMDRCHDDLARRLDAVHPAVLQLIDRVAQAGRAHQRSVSLCGALAADVEALPLLVGLGLRELSMPAGAIARVKRELRTLDADACRALAQRALALPTAAAVRELLAGARTARPETMEVPR